MNTKIEQVFLDDNHVKYSTKMNLIVEEIKDTNGTKLSNPTIIKQETDEFSDYAVVNIKKEELDIKEETTTNVNETASATALKVSVSKQEEACDEKLDVTNKTKRFKCHTCSRTFSSKAMLINHLRTHTGEKPYNCNICDFKSSYRYYLRTHMKIHTGEKPFCCTLCDYKSKRKSLLIQHERTHTGERPFKCTFCEYRSSQKSQLNRHTRLHTGDLSYSCNICDYKCYQKSHLTGHLKTHAVEKQFCCASCNYTSNKKSRFVQHYKKTMCVPTGDLPYKCDICNYKCYLQSDLTAHLKTHVAIKPFSCSSCDYKGSTKLQLVKHYKTHRSATCVYKKPVVKNEFVNVLEVKSEQLEFVGVVDND